MHTLKTAAEPSGVVHSGRLRELGFSKRGIRLLVLDSILIPVLRGWYATADASPEAVQAIALGGRLGCVSLLRLHGLWVHDDQELHVDLGGHATGQRLGADPGGARRLVVHWQGRTDPTRRDSPTSSAIEALRRVVVCQDRDFAIATIDSALHQRMLTIGQLRDTVLSGLPARYRGLSEEVDARAESGLESIARVRLRRSGFTVAVQEAVCGGRFRLDLVVDGDIAVELDGREFHEREAAFVADRRRDSRVIAEGYVVARFAYTQVLYEWQSVERAVRALAARRLRTPDPFRRKGGCPS